MQATYLRLLNLIPPSPNPTSCTLLYLPYRPYPVLSSPDDAHSQVCSPFDEHTILLCDIWHGNVGWQKPDWGVYSKKGRQVVLLQLAFCQFSEGKFVILLLYQKRHVD